jgi:probable rRNA maturation factor
MTPEIDIAIPCSGWNTALKDAATLCRRAVSAAIDAAHETLPDPYGRVVEVSIVLADDAEIAGLNQQFRDRDGATNVLSFPALSDEEQLGSLLGVDGPPVLLGDVVLAFETISTEAADQDKIFGEHVTHLLIHGILHLLGYDHLDDAEAQVMEQLEIRALAALGVADPYADAEDAPIVA